MLMQFKLKSLILVLCMAGVTPSFAADAGTTLATQSSSMDQLSSQQSSSTVTSKFAGDFAEFAGSQQNAEALIIGLRMGTPIILSGTTTTTTATNTTITPPTQPMGYGNTYIALSLAKAQLAQYGITEPTPQQLNAALTGGTITTTSVSATGTTLTKTVTLDGILTQRASGLGWGQIAKVNGFKLGQVISSMKSENKRLAGLNAHSDRLSGDRTSSSKGLKFAESGSTKTRHHSSSQSITTALSGGGVVYGKSHANSSAKLAGSHGNSASAATRAPSVNMVSAAGSTTVHGNSANAPGKIKGPK